MEDSQRMRFVDTLREFLNLDQNRQEEAAELAHQLRQEQDQEDRPNP